jgi:hypothetical protein
MATRAITINAPAESVWPWLAQLGQGRGGFYSYDVLENMVGCQIHSADRIVPSWQLIRPGDHVNLAPDIALTVALVRPAEALVLRGGIPLGAVPAPYDFTWAFALQPVSNSSCRLIVRERYTYSRRWAPLILVPVQVVSMIMTHRMLKGIRARAEQPATAASRRLAKLVGLAALVSSVLYFLSDVIEGAQGGFSSGQLWLTLVAEAMIPAFVVGLYVVQRPPIGRLGLASAMAYAASFVYFTGTVAYALIKSTKDWDTLSDQLGPILTIDGALYVVAGIGFGSAIVRAGRLPRWTGIALIVGVILVAATQNMSEGVQLIGVGVRDLAFAGMGLSLLRAANRPAAPAD